MLSPISFKDDTVRILDQRLLPHTSKWLTCTTVDEVAVAIETMAIRGAPAIGCAAGFGLALDAQNNASLGIWLRYRSVFEHSVARLRKTRPTAVNLFYALEQFTTRALRYRDDQALAMIADEFSQLANTLYAHDLATCRAIGEHGAMMAKGSPVTVLTHCNAGSLATAGYGTALGVVRSLHQRGILKHVYVDETRPFLQGSRLTAYELHCEGIDHTLITDSTAAYLMQQGMIDWVVTGADRIAVNGDTANKIGTYSLAVNAHHHKIRFYVAAPISTFDFLCHSGQNIPIELRNGDEVTHFNGQRIAPSTTLSFNPSFDVTPAELITGIVTEKGVLKPPFAKAISQLS